MGKGLNRDRRRQKHQREQAHPNIAHINENPTTALRLVRPKVDDIPSEPVTPGRASEAIDRVQEQERSNGIGGSETSEHHVEPAVDAGTDDLPSVVRSFDTAEINKVFNHETVFPFVSVPDSPAIDVSPILLDHRNVLMMDQGGGVLFIWQEPGIYEVHTAFLQEHRGLSAIRGSKAAYRWMFTHTDCMVLQTRVPSFNKAAETFCRVVGATREFDRKAIWKTKNGYCDMSFWSLQYNDWVRQAKALKESGKKFHDRLDEEFSRLGKTEPRHLDEECHDQYVGACAETIYGGQVDKAVILYNRWAMFSGYGPISLVAHNPVVIDIGDAVIQVEHDTFKVIVAR